MSVQESYPAPTTGQNVATQIVLSGTGVTQIAGNRYKVQLSLSGTSTVSVTAAAKDINGNAVTVGAGDWAWTSDNAKPSAANSNDVQESYPVPVTPFAFIATVGTGAATETVTSHKEGMALITVKLPFADANQSGLNAVAQGAVYAELFVTVVA